MVTRSARDGIAYTVPKPSLWVKLKMQDLHWATYQKATQESVQQLLPIIRPRHALGFKLFGLLGSLGVLIGVSMRVRRMFWCQVHAVFGAGT